MTGTGWCPRKSLPPFERMEAKVPWGLVSAPRRERVLRIPTRHLCQHSTLGVMRISKPHGQAEMDVHPRAWSRAETNQEDAISSSDFVDGSAAVVGSGAVTSMVTAAGTTCSAPSARIARSSTSV